MNIKSIFFPTDFTCDVCGVETFKSNLCADCKKTVEFNNGITCPLCGRKTVIPEICLECKASPPLFRKAVSAFVYGGGSQILIYKFKNGNGYLKENFANLLAPKISELPKADYLIGVPMLRRDKTRRGYNQSELLAKSLSKRTGIPNLNGAIKKVWVAEQQKALSRAQRAENLKGCFKVEKPHLICGKKIIIVDDVLTTGATADELTRILILAGATDVFLATVASVEYKIKTARK